MAERNLCSALILAAVTSMAAADGGQKRSDDVNTLQPVLERLSQDVVALQSQLTAQNSKIEAQNSKIEAQNNKIDTQNNVIEAQRQRIEALEAADSYTVAFSAYISEPNTHAAGGATVPFCNVITNVGGAYNPSSSAFTAPVAGQYFFIVHADCSPDYHYIHIKVNERHVIAADNDGFQDHHVTGSGLVTLQMGDVVTAIHYTNDCYLDGGYESTFTGFLVK